MSCNGTAADLISALRYCAQIDVMVLEIRLPVIKACLKLRSKTHAEAFEARLADQRARVTGRDNGVLQRNHQSITGLCRVYLVTDLVMDD